MTILVMALYAEGSVDTRFLPPLLQRTSEVLLAKYGQCIIDVPEAIIIPKKHDKLDNCIFQASKEAKNCDVLFVHSDSDNLKYSVARKQRFDPGFTLVQQSKEDVCRHLVPVIPIRMIEAWMLADPHALYQILGTNLNPQLLDLSHKTSSVENIAKPKEILNEIVRNVNASRSRRRQTISLHTKYELLARQIDLNKLFEIPSYKEFVVEFTRALEELHIVSYGAASKIAIATSFCILKSN